jgi:predicted Rossmann-fold nucleotide-binding protein
MNNSDAKEDQARVVSLADEEAVKQILVDSVFGLWEVVNNLTRLRPSKRDRYRATIFGSARARPGTFAYDEVKRVAAALAELGCDIVTGGGPGLMQAANEGASVVGAPERSRSVGIRVELPFEHDANPFVQQAFEHKTFFTRLHHFVLTSDIFIVAPGGIGTVLELTMVWQLLQVQHVQNTPLILVGKMWAELVDWAKKNLLGVEKGDATRMALELL